MIDKFKVIKITIDYKKDKFSKENNQAQKAALETEIDNQQNKLAKYQEEILQLNQRLKDEVTHFYE